MESSAQKVTSLLALLAIETECEAPRVEENCIYFKNCTVELVTQTTQTTLRRHPAAPVALCRVPHNFDPTVGEPTQFIAFLETLFQPDDIPTIHEIWEDEQQEIILWLVKGALKLVRQNYRLTESAASRAEVKALKRSDNTALEFLQEQTFIYTENAATPSSQLTGKYREWCYDHDLFRVSGQVFKQTCEQFFAPHGVVYTKKTPSHVGQVRGYKGVMFG